MKREKCVICHSSLKNIYTLNNMPIKLTYTKFSKKILHEL